MNTRAFYGARKVTYVSTLAEVNEIIEKAKHVVNVAVLLPEAEDYGSHKRAMLKMLLVIVVVVV